MKACPACGREALEGARFCAFCGAGLAITPVAREERKVVSVVFVDLVGHTSRSEAADPEDVRALLAPYHARARAELERFGGRVEKFIGDAVMAVFGAPTAHEDDAERAVRGALAVRDVFVEEGLSVRIAVNTGEALVLLSARPEAGESMVAGDVVNTAARLQSAAPVDSVLVGAATRRSTERAIEYRDVPAVDAKGKAEPVVCAEALRPRARHGVDVSQHGGAPLVGRETERRLLVDALDRAGRERSLQLVTLVGAPGMGKSRLVWELYRDLDERSGLVASWRQGRALAYGGGAFDALADVLRAEVGALETDDAVAARNRLLETLAACSDDESERAWLLRALEPLLGSGDGVTRAEAFGAWQRFFELLADNRPLVLVLEDIHWADDGTLDFVEHLADWSTDSPLLVLCTARPELLDRRPMWGGGRLNSQTISLAPLDDTATAELLAKILGRPVVDADLQQTLLTQAGGNPLYAEEFARMIAETGRTGDVPPTVQGVIAARLDVLPAAEKTLLQDASVLGKVFWRGGVEAVGASVSDEDLASLTRRELLRRARVSTVDGETEFAFRHALVRDVAYGQIPRAARADKHRRAAEWIATTAATRSDIVAHHYLEALHLTEAAGGEAASLREPARAALTAAGDRARSLGALDSALALFRRALELDPDDMELVLRVAFAAADYEGSGLAEARHAWSHYMEVGNPLGAARAAVAITRCLWLAGDAPAAHTAIADAVAQARLATDGAVLGEALEEQARGLMTAGRYDEAIAAAEEAVTHATRHGLPAAAVNARVTLATSLANLGDARGLPMLEEAAEEADRLNESRALLRALNNVSHVHWMSGRLELSWQALLQARERTARFLLPITAAWLTSNGASMALALGNWTQAARLLEEYERVTGAEPYYLDAQSEKVRAIIAYGRDEPNALDELERLAAHGSSADPQALRDGFEFLGIALALDGRLGDATALADGLAASVYWESSSAYPGLLSAMTGVHVTGGLEAGSPWYQANTLLASNRFEEALAILDTIGARTDAAIVRLVLAQRQGPEPWATDAEQFFRGVGATRFLREIDSLRAGRQSA
jgi:class 3 adenylate cyclase/tetratricopeptide (TPR) repeat protein